MHICSGVTLVKRDALKCTFHVGQRGPCECGNTIPLNQAPSKMQLSAFKNKTVKSDRVSMMLTLQSEKCPFLEPFCSRLADERDGVFVNEKVT